ncbi:hypothetical protein MSG28_016032 [Choristoneura fumiferana]|uniref:Uncharacterized protein n=1 Tax=Choristoneura fumiferana TaxID=7141 RepID=A0ACC0K557_CHOFU|nr:hypothetical protein MSG28_016032 [Choristoneura fumiferana]
MAAQMIVQNPTISQPMLLGVPSLIAANFDPSRSTVVLIHGWTLEPPRPGFNLNSNAFLSTDGIFTEAMHTNAGVTGLVQPVADVDFYPNGGTTMAGCRCGDAVSLLVSSHCGHDTFSRQYDPLPESGCGQ